MRTIIFLFFVLFSNFASSENHFFDQIARHFLDIAGRHNKLDPSYKTFGQEPKGPGSQNDAMSELPEVETASGRVIGATYTESHSFYSVPYAQAPIGELRFQPPLALEDKKEINASVPDFVECHQFDRNCTDEFECDKNYSEDCLVLNIFVPSTINLSSLPSERLPVMFWLHGGAFFFGSGTIFYFDSRWLCNVTNTIVVTVNYRLGPLGFMVYEEDGESFEGNQGIKDQQLALQWVYENIENFGGDKDMITMFGQSAGAQSVTFHLMSDKSKPFFKRAIMQSNPAGYYYFSKQEALTKADALLSAINCTESGMECLMSTPAQELVSAHLKVAFSQPLNFFNVIEPFRPVLNEEFPQQPLEVFQSGNWHREKEVIIGVTSEEVAYISVFLKDITVRKSLFEAFTTFVVGEEFAQAVIAKYYDVAGNPTKPTFDYTDILAQEIADMLFVCPSKTLARYMSSTSSAASPFPAVYFYVHDYRMEASNCEDFSSFCGYAFHAAELPFVFSNGPMRGLLYTENDYAIENLYNNFWGHFAYNGSPTGNLTAWPYYASESVVESGVAPWSHIRFAAPQSLVENQYSEDLCEFWDNLGIYGNISTPTQLPEETDPTTISLDQTDTTTSGAESLCSCVYVFVLCLLSFLYVY